MLYSDSRQVQPVDGVIEGDLNDTEGWMTPNPAGFEGMRQAMFLLGDPKTGPAILFTDREPGPEAGIRAHHHRAGTFRIMIGEEPKQIKHAGRWMGFGDFFAIDSKVMYAERLGSVHHLSLVMEADRRGSVSLFAKEDLAQVAQTFKDRVKSGFGFDWPVWERDEDATPSKFVTTFAETPERFASIPGSLDDDTWTVLSDGSAVAAVFLEGPEDGPLVVMTRNAPNAVEAPAGAYASDRLRLILQGDCRIGDRTYGAGQLRITAAGVSDEAIVHGPSGSTQLLILADRRGWLPVDAVETPETARLWEIDRFLEGYKKDMLAGAR